MAGDLGLGSLLAALRTAGLRVAVPEVERLHRVFALAPDLTEGDGAAAGDRLGSVLRAALARSREEQELFDRVFEAWWGEAEGALAARAPQPPPKSGPGPIALGPRNFRLLMFLGVAAGAITLIGAIVVLSVPISKTRPWVDGLLSEFITSSLQFPETAGESETSRQESKVPLLPVHQAADWLPWALASLALLAGGGLGILTWRRRWFPAPAPLPDRPGPPEFAWTRPESSAPELLDPAQQETLIYGIGRFVAEEETRRLDLRSSARATARAAGLLQLRFERARFHREVWLWLDESARDPTLGRLADEIEQILAAQGLPVERAVFRGVPARLVSAIGEVFAANELEDRRQAAIVAVLTDGRLLARQHEGGGARRLAIEAALRTLSGWPQLAFVLPEAAHGRAILAAHGLPVLAPWQLAAFLAGGRPARRAVAPDSLPWAAACALAPAPVAEAAAFELRRALGLAAPPWAAGAFPRSGAGRIAWEPGERARLLNWFGAAEEHPLDEVAEGSRLDRALRYWEEAYAREEHSRSAAADHAPWAGTPAEHTFRLQKALLGLWRRAALPATVRELYALFQGPLRAAVPAQLRQLAPAGAGAADRVRLPWRWESLQPVERAMLAEMKFGGGELPPVRLRRPARVWLALGLSLGLGGGGLVLAVREEAAAVVAAKPMRKMEFVQLPGGTFRLGSDAADPMADRDESPAHQVTVSAFELGKYEVTNEQYRVWQPRHEGSARYPAVNVSWEEADQFCRAFGFRLPTEAEWEYAARAGTRTRWSFGDEEVALDRYAWYTANSKDTLQPVGRKQPNPWGLHDMHGNASEWVGDWYGDYSAAAQVDPAGPTTGNYRALRGGSFIVALGVLRSADRDWFEPSVRFGDVGFRCVRASGREP